MPEKTHDSLREEILEEFENILPIKCRFNPKEPIYGEENRRDMVYIKSFLSKSLDQIHDSAYQQGFIDGSDVTGTQAKEIEAEKVAEAYSIGKKEGIEMAVKKVDEVTGHNKNYIPEEKWHEDCMTCYILEALEKLKSKE